MKYGKIRIEDGFLVFTRHMMINNLPCKDIVLAYMRKEGADEGDDRQLSVNYLVIVTRRKKRYKFDMTEKEIHECIRILKILNPDMATGFPKGGRISLHSLPNTRDLGAIVTADDRHILPRRLLRSGELYHISESDKNRLREEYNLKTVIDLRSAEERKCKPDTIIAEVEYYHVPVVDEDVQVISNREQFVKMLAGLPDDMEEYMIRQYRNLCMDHNGYGVKSGTSMSTPLVAGAAALMLEKNPELTNVQIKMKLKESARDMGLPKNQQGWGELDLERFMEL